MSSIVKKSKGTVSKEKKSRKCRPSPFTNQKVLNQLIEDFKKGMSWERMERKYKTSHGTVYKALKESGVLVKGKRRKVLPPELTDTSVIVDAYKSGMDIKSISKKYKISTRTVTIILEEANAKPVGRRSCIVFRNDEKLKALIKAYEEGMTWAEMKKNFNASGTTIARMLKRAGVKTGGRHLTTSSENNSRKKSEKVGRKAKISDEQTIREIIADYESKMPWKQMACKYNISAKTLSRILKKAGVKFRRNSQSSTFLDIIENDEEKKQQFIEAYKKGTPWKKMYEEVGISESYGRKILKDAGVSLIRKKGYTAEEKAQIASLYLEQNISLKELAYMYCDTRFHLERMLKSCGIAIRDESNVEFVAPVRHLTDEDKKKIMELREKKWTIHEIARELNVSYENVKHYIRDNKKKAK